MQRIPQPSKGLSAKNGWEMSITYAFTNCVQRERQLMHNWHHNLLSSLTEAKAPHSYLVLLSFLSQGRT